MTAHPELKRHNKAAMRELTMPMKYCQQNCAVEVCEFSQSLAQVRPPPLKRWQTLTLDQHSFL